MGCAAVNPSDGFLDWTSFNLSCPTQLRASGIVTPYSVHNMHFMYACMYSFGSKGCAPTSSSSPVLVATTDYLLVTSPLLANHLRRLKHLGTPFPQIVLQTTSMLPSSSKWYGASTSNRTSTNKICCGQVLSGLASHINTIHRSQDLWWLMNPTTDATPEQPWENESRAV